MENTPPPPTRKVGVYERPASADRPSIVKKVVLVVAIVIAVAIAAMLIV